MAVGQPALIIADAYPTEVLEGRVAHRGGGYQQAPDASGVAGVGGLSAPGHDGAVDIPPPAGIRPSHSQCPVQPSVTVPGAAPAGGRLAERVPVRQAAGHQATEVVGVGAGDVLLTDEQAEGVGAGTSIRCARSRDEHRPLLSSAHRAADRAALLLDNRMQTLLILFGITSARRSSSSSPPSLPVCRATWWTAPGHQAHPVLPLDEFNRLAPLPAGTLSLLRESAAQRLRSISNWQDVVTARPAPAAAAVSPVVSGRWP